MSTKFTPGPWHAAHPYATPEWQAVPAGEAHGAFEYASLGIGQGDKLLAEVRADRSLFGGFPSVQDMDELRANAALMAAAPELYDALDKLFVQALQSEVNDRTNEYGIEAISIARAALAKARGEA